MCSLRCVQYKCDGRSGWFENNTIAIGAEFCTRLPVYDRALTQTAINSSRQPGDTALVRVVRSSVRVCVVISIQIALRTVFVFICLAHVTALACFQHKSCARIIVFKVIKVNNQRVEIEPYLPGSCENRINSETE